jgi:hypothetical protein
VRFGQPWQISQRPAIVVPSALNVPVNRWEKSSGEKSGLSRHSFLDAHLVDARDAARVEVMLEAPAAVLPRARLIAVPAMWIQFHEDLLATLGIPRGSDI